MDGEHQGGTWNEQLFKAILGEIVEASSQREVARRSGVSQTYVGNLLQVPGKRPRIEDVWKIMAAFPKRARDLAVAAGVPLPPQDGVAGHALASASGRVPLGPPISAMVGKDLGDVGVSGTQEVPQRWIDEGATMAVTVDGLCLAPRLQPGDVVVLRPQDHAHHGQIVLARLEDGSYTLKRYAENGGPHLTTADPSENPPPAGKFQVVAVMVSFIGQEG